jgi:hypothetical protein
MGRLSTLKAKTLWNYEDAQERGVKISASDELSDWLLLSLQLIKICN